MADPSPFGGGELLRVAVARTRVEHAPERQSGPLTATLVVSLAVERALDVVVAGGGVLQLLAASVPLTPGGAGTQQALIAPLSAGTI